MTCFLSVALVVIGAQFFAMILFTCRVLYRKEISDGKTTPLRHLYSDPSPCSSLIPPPLSFLANLESLSRVGKGEEINGVRALCW
jgi:hypothetical protein